MVKSKLKPKKEVNEREESENVPIEPKWME